MSRIIEGETNRKIPVGILGATGMVGRRFITLLQNHPWFEVVAVAASPRSAGKTIANLTVQAVEADMNKIAQKVRLVFSALNMKPEDIKRIEDAYAFLGVGVISTNSAHRWTPDVPMIIPEINPGHLDLIDFQRRNHGWREGFVVVKPNCSIQSYVPPITALWQFEPTQVIVTTFQAVSGAGRTLENWPEMKGNVMPFIEGEEEKSALEPLKIWGELEGDLIRCAISPVISATCIRVPIEDGHTASVVLSFAQRVTRSDILDCWRQFNPLRDLNLPSSPSQFITVREEEQDNRPQVLLDVMNGGGMSITVGRLRESSVLDYVFVGLSHNTIRGAAGGAILTAELLKVKGYI